MLTILFASFFFFSALAAQAADVFTYDLKMGMISPEVKLLQQALNSNIDTSVAVSGAGSKGLETEYFGARTLSAVIKFQEKYRNEILVPAGLASGTGFVGSYTRAVLNRLQAPLASSTSSPVSNIAAQASATSNVASPTAYEQALYSKEIKEMLVQSGLDPDYFVGDNWKKYPQILDVSLTEASPGDTITFSGINLEDPSLKLTFGGQDMAFQKPSSNSFVFTIPKSFPYCYCSLELKKDGATYQKNDIYILVKKKGAVAPQISGVRSLVSTPSINDTITIEGTGFTNTNDIITSFGELWNVPRSGANTIALPLSKLSTLTQTSEYQKSISAGVQTSDMVIYIRNQNGNSNAYQLKISL